MISKKSRKVVAALLIGATVCASGTFAYFNSKVDMDKIANGGAMKKLEITNGYINVTGELVGNTSVKASGWTYDVATKSGATEADRSPDIIGFDDTGAYAKTTSSNATNTTILRTVIGAPLTGTVSAARPGDAIVLGDAADANGGGIKIKNSTNLTCKAIVAFRENGTDAEKSLEAMASAGWVMYVNDTKIDLKADTHLDGSNTVVDKSIVDKVNDVLGDVAATIQSNGGEAFIRVRFELPLLTDNQYQNQTNAGANGAPFDLSDILDIVVTQENNPGWGTDGSSDLPAVQTPDNNNGNNGTGFKGGENENVNADGTPVRP